MATALDEIGARRWDWSWRVPPRDTPNAASRSPRTAERATETAVLTNPKSDSWQLDVRRKLKELVELQDGWDGHGGVAVKPEIAQFALQLLIETMPENVAGPQLVPMSYGGLQLEWYENDIELEIEIEAPNRISMLCENIKTGDEIETEMSTDFSQLTHCLQSLVGF